MFSKTFKKAEDLTGDNPCLQGFVKSLKMLGSRLFSLRCARIGLDRQLTDVAHDEGQFHHDKCPRRASQVQTLPTTLI